MARGNQENWDEAELPYGVAWRRHLGKSPAQRAELARDAVHARFDIQEIDERLDAHRFLDSVASAKTPEEKARLLLEYGSITGVTNPDYIRYVKSDPEMVERDFKEIFFELRDKYKRE